MVLNACNFTNLQLIVNPTFINMKKSKKAFLCQV